VSLSKNSMSDSSTIKAARLEANFLNMEKQIEANKVQNALEHSEIKAVLKDSLNKIENKLDTTIEKLETAINNKANKWVESGLKFIYVSTAIVFIGLLVRFIVLLEL